MRFLPSALAGLALWISVPSHGERAEQKMPQTDDAPREELTLDKIFAEREETPEPSQLEWTTGNRLSYFLETQVAEGDAAKEDPTEKADDEPGRDLWILDYQTGKREILLSADQLLAMAPSPEQATQDERERTRRSRFDVAAYLWSPDGRSLLFTSSGKLLLYRLADGTTRQLAPGKENVLDPKFSPDGRHVAFVYEHDLWWVPTDGGEEKQLTTGGHELLLHGDLDWVYPEEFRVRTGYHFSPDGGFLAFLESDQSRVPEYPITDKLGRQATVDLQRYPQPGDPNPKVRVGIVDLKSGHTAWFDREAEYIPRFSWADEKTLAVQLLDRAQEKLELTFADPATGVSRSVFVEQDPHWINVRNDLTFLPDGKHFLWTSDRGGLRHLYLYGRDGKLVRALTAGEFQVTEVHGVDEEGRVYYSSNEDNLLGSDLYRIALDGSHKERLTEQDGTHRVDMRPDVSAFVDDFSSWTDPGGRHVQDVATGRRVEMTTSEDERERFPWITPQMKELRTEDGELVRVLLLVPEGAESSDEKRPVLTFVYGMPGYPVIRNSWLGGTRNLFHQFVAQQGWVVAYVDDRSASIPGHKHAAKADHNIGPVAAEDHRVAVEYLKGLPYVDEERFAVWGWSGGGFLTAFHMAHTDLFSVGVAGAPPTDWRLYDSIYTERYMGHPDEVPEAYDRTSAILGAENVTGRLLLIHGTHDDNVHPQNTLQMADALVKAGKQFDLMLYPNKTHGVSGNAHRRHMYTLIWEFLQRHL